MPKPPQKKTYRDFKRKPRVFSQIKADYIDYKDIDLLRRFMSDRAKIRPRKMSGNSIQEQRLVARAIKNAREMALIPFNNRITSQKVLRSYGSGHRDDYEDEREAEAYASLTQQALKKEKQQKRPGEKTGEKTGEQSIRKTEKPALEVVEAIAKPETPVEENTPADEREKNTAEDTSETTA